MLPGAVIALCASTASAAVAPRQASVNQAVIPPSFGVTAGQGKNQVQPGSCTGVKNKPIPCFCPPAPNSPEFLSRLTKALTKGFIFSPGVVKIPISLHQFNDASDTSPATNKLRATAMIQVIQNFNLTTPGVGCPGVATPVLTAMQRTGQICSGTSSVGNPGR